jgi:hypothetical protein
MLTFATYAVSGRVCQSQGETCQGGGATGYEFTQQWYEIGGGKFMEFEKE